MLIPSAEEDGLVSASVGEGHMDTLMLVDIGFAPLIWDMVTHIIAPLIHTIDLTRLIFIKM
ncbi:hypothetical protein ES703_105750 [subsurface metagenome]